MISSLRRLHALMLGALVVLTPTLALACPSCAAGNNGGSGLKFALGAFLLLPFGVAGVVYSVLRSEAE